MQATELLIASDPSPTRMISDQDYPHRLSVTGAGFVTAAQQIAAACRLSSFGFLRADKINNIDAALVKSSRLWEGKTVHFRAEALNLYNHPYFPIPVTNSTTSNFEQITASNQANSPRRP